MSALSKKHYVGIAMATLKAREEIINKEPDDNQQDLQDGVSYTVEFMADYFASENPRFDRAKFLAACGVSQ